jgi:nucleotide-binding universal stress UspA family protein
MKTILVPTDFSKTAGHAVDYAAELAAKTNATLILLNVYHPPLIASEVPVVIPTLEEVEKDAMLHLKKSEKKLHEKFGSNFSIESKCKCGFAVDEILEFSAKHKADLIVMGMHGAGYITEKLIGGISSAVMDKATCPVLAVNLESKFTDLKKIVLACDYAELSNKTILDPLKELAQMFNSHIYVLNVMSKNETSPTITKAIAGIKMEHALETLEHSFHYLESEDVVKGINEFAQENKADLIVMIPRKHSFFHNLLHEPNTKKMVFHSSTPIFSIHE